MNKVTPLVVVAVRECMCAGQRGGAGGGGPSPPRGGRHAAAPPPLSRPCAVGTRSRNKGQGKRAFPFGFGGPPPRGEGGGTETAAAPLPRDAPPPPPQPQRGRAGERGALVSVMRVRASPSRAKRVPDGRRGPPCPRPRASVLALSSSRGGCRGTEPASPDLRQDPGHGAVSERGTESCHLDKARSAPRARSSLWTRAVAGGLGPVPVGQESARPQWRSQ